MCVLPVHPSQLWFLIAFCSWCRSAGRAELCVVSLMLPRRLNAGRVQARGLRSLVESWTTLTAQTVPLQLLGSDPVTAEASWGFRERVLFTRKDPCVRGSLLNTCLHQDQRAHGGSRRHGRTGRRRSTRRTTRALPGGAIGAKHRLRGVFIFQGHRLT